MDEAFSRKIADQVRQADDDAYASMLAWQLGTDAFQAHIKKQAESAYERIQVAYDAITDELGQPFPEGDSTGGSRTSGGSGESPSGHDSSSEADTGGL